METGNSFEQFFHDRHERFYYFALRFLNDEEACRDVVKDTMEYIYRNLTSIEESKRESYALSFIRSRCIDTIRRRGVKQRYLDFYKAYAERLDVVALDAEEDQMGQLMQAVEQLPEKTRYALKECYLNQKKYREVALEMGISEEGVHKNIVRALKMLREKFAKI